MNRFLRMLPVVFLLTVLVVPAAPASARVAAVVDPLFFAGCEEGVFGTGASWVICMPERGGVEWKGDLVIFVHGYVSPYPERAPEIPLDQYKVSVGGMDVKVQDVINQMGYAFATTSFRTNGLAVKDGVADITQLLGRFKSLHQLTPSARVFLLGFSEGGLITTQVIEKHQAQFAGGIAACGPIGDFRKQIDHMGDMRIGYDFYFKGMLPDSPLTPGGTLLPSPIDIPEPLMANWDSLSLAIGGTLAARPDLTAQLLVATGAPQIIIDNPATWIPSVIGVLWYDIFAMNDARAKLGGNPFSNIDRQYIDLALDAGAERYAADRNALARIEAQYQTTGRLKSPLVTLHNIGDPVVPYWHETLYEQKIAASGSTALYNHIAADTYGHCNFTQEQIMDALGWLVMMTGG
jgi:pimeloyl-ACP methyl ester carboxylesterase